MDLRRHFSETWLNIVLYYKLNELNITIEAGYLIDVIEADAYNIDCCRRHFHTV